MLIGNCLLQRILWQAILDDTGENSHKRVKPKTFYWVVLRVLTCKVCSLSTHRHPSLACVHRIRLFMISPWTSLSGYNCNNIIVITINTFDTCALGQTVHDFPLTSLSGYNWNTIIVIIIVIIITFGMWDSGSWLPLDRFVWVQLKHHHHHFGDVSIYNFFISLLHQHHHHYHHLWTSSLKYHI